MSRSRIHRDLVFLFVLIKALAKQIDFGLGRARVVGAVVAKHGRSDVLQIFRIGKQALIVNHAGGKSFGLGEGVKRQAAAHAEPEHRDFFVADPRKLAQVRHAVDNVMDSPWNIEGCLFQGAVFKGMIGLAMKKIRRETDKTFLGKAARHRSLAIVQAAITMNQDDRRPLAASARPGKEPVDDFFAAPMSGMHGDDSFSHSGKSKLRGKRETPAER